MQLPGTTLLVIDDDDHVRQRISAHLEHGGYDVLPLAFPALAGFTLVGPLIATGMYELSRRRELGMEVSRWNVFEVIRSPSIWSIILLGLLLRVSL